MKVYLIGAGPGDPGLFTLRGRDCLAAADVVVYDALANDALLAHARKDAELIYVGKVAGDHALPQDKINQLSEIQKSTVVVTGKTALVGVTFTGSYAGELTQRIHDMVAAQVQSADASIEKVAVTSDKEDVRKIEELASKIQSGTPASDLEQEIDSIARNVTTMS